MLSCNWKRGGVAKVANLCCPTDTNTSTTSSNSLSLRESSFYHHQQQRQLRVESFKMDHLRIVIHVTEAAAGAEHGLTTTHHHQRQQHYINVFNRWTRHFERV